MCANSQKKPENDPVRTVDWLLLDADWLVTCDPRMGRHRGWGVAIEGNRLVAAGPSDALRKSFRAEREFDLTGYLLMPGLVNTHVHGAMSLLRGIGDDLPLKTWLEEIIFPLEAAVVNPDTVYLGTLLSAVEMLKSGTTTFCDGYFFEEEAARAAIDSGMRGVLGQGLLDFPTPDLSDPSRFVSRAEKFLENFPSGCDRVRPSLFCHAPYTCSPETLKRVKEICRGEKILFQTHLSETSGEVEDIKNRYGKTPGMHLDALGVLDSLTLCAHGIWLTPEEIPAVAAAGASVAHCPESAMKLASGVPSIPDMLAAGMKVGLGTDGCASNNDLDLFSEMDMGAKLLKAFRKDPVVFPAEQALCMATLGGASALGMEGEIGSIEAGKKADLVAVDLNQPHLVPIYDPVSHIVYSARGSDVRHVWVDGKLVVENGRVLTVDEGRILSDAARVGKDIARRLV